MAALSCLGQALRCNNAAMAKVASSVAAIRVAVRRCLIQLPAEALVLVACSGGGDSMALADAVAFEAPRRGYRAGLITVDHGLQAGSTMRAERLVEWARAAGLAPAEAVSVTVGASGGPEAAAREARYAALDEAAARHHAVAVLLAHTRGDQAETVLLGLARGSGARSLAGMAPVRGVYRRPLLTVDRSATRQSCSERDLPVWDDPHNEDPAFTRSRLRRALPLVEETIGPGVIAGLARTARLLRADSEYLEAAAERRIAELFSGRFPVVISVAVLAGEPMAIRTRLLHRWAIKVGARAGAVGASHIDALNDLVENWHGQGEVSLPDALAAGRVDGHLRIVTR